MSRVQFKGFAAALLIPVLMLLGACEPHEEEIAALQQTIVRDVVNAGNTGPREALPLVEFVQDEFAAAGPSISWASAELPKDDASSAGMIGINALVVPSEAGFPKVTLRFKYDPATKQVTYRDALAGKKPLVDKDARPVLLAGTYEELKARVDAAKAKADAKAKAKEKKKKAKDNKDKVAHDSKTAAGIGRS
jgi:hypothetical protein